MFAPRSARLKSRLRQSLYFGLYLVLLGHSLTLVDREGRGKL
jgi:hypothetical protein